MYIHTVYNSCQVTTYLAFPLKIARESWRASLFQGYCWQICIYYKQIITSRVKEAFCVPVSIWAGQWITVFFIS